MAVEAQEFAARLRTLKDRSGKSYGQLSTRLRVSNSTLHRYCHGTTVPPSFALAERLARLCGATPDELVELHRLWLVADAAREQKPAPTAPAPVPAEPGSDLTTREEVGTATASAADGRAAAEPAAASGTTLWWRRPWTVIGATAAVVAVVAVTAVAVPTGPSNSRTVSGHAAAAQRSAAPPTPDASAASPLQVSVLDDNWDDPCDRWYLSDRAPGSVPAPPDPNATAAWAARLGAVPAGRLRLELTVQATGDEPVVLHALYVHARHAGPAPHWSAFNMGTGCGGGVTPASFAIDLDATAPTARPTPGIQGDTTVPALAFPLQASHNQPQVLDIDAGAKNHDVSWTLELLWSQGSRQGTLLVDDHGHPFRTAGTTGAPRYVYDLGGTNTWTPDRHPQDAEDLPR
ncbi:helix-turn-helix domain-containing protein [Streptacidiphilus anmyonensis]|uniref:helix-turn-helix domain-containing protein n=1 Tax=Streptacidiphilus anmyonensis TaxID=405782 RepID=UPI0005AA607F|nr:helix-turn-helix transcriptional regulator [Streptacidiphilus anmyonensis]